MKHCLVLSLILMFVLVACGAPTPAPVATPTTSPSPTSQISDDRLNLLIVARGPVQLKRDGWPNYQPIAFGVDLRRGDMLQLGPGAQATVLCADLTALPAPAGVPSGAINNCPPQAKPAIVRKEGTMGPTKAPVDPLIPYVISPRKTRLISGQPVLRWNAVTGVTTYTVSLRGDDNSDWLTRTVGTEIVYPTSAPPLKAGVNYLLQIQADNGRTSKEESAPGLGFKLLKPEESEPIRASEARLRALKLPPEAETYALAHLYAGQDLIAEAVELLEKLVKVGSQEAAVYRTLGDLYHRIGLEQLAEDRYLKAKQLAEQAGDIEGLAICLADLGEVYISLGNRDQALEHWRQALAQYRIIGDRVRFGQVQKRIDDTR